MAHGEPRSRRGGANRVRQSADGGRRSVRDAKERDDREAEAAAHKAVEQSSIGQSPNTNDLPTSAAEPFFGRAAGPVFVECLQIGFEDFLAIGELDSKH